MQLNCSSTTRSSHSGDSSFILTDRSLSYCLRHLRAVEEDRGEELHWKSYINSSVQDSKNLTSLYLAAMAKEDAEAELRPPGFHLPNLADLNETEATWKAVAINYSFGSLGMAIPGWDSGKGSARYNSPESGQIHRSTLDFAAPEAGDLFFNSKPSVMSLSLNNKPVSFKGEGVLISFEHQNDSMVGLLSFLSLSGFLC